MPNVVEGFDVLGEVFAVLEVELLLTALLGGAGNRVSVRPCGPPPRPP
jgi:hypothetical protein